MSSTSVPPAPPGSGRRRNPLTALVLILIGIAVVVGASAFLPRWWSHRVADQANGSFSSGIGLGLFYGFTFTLAALVVLWVGLRRIHSWKGRLILLVVALLLSAPNLLTLGIVFGPGGAAHAGERTLDVDAPGFRSSSAIGAIVAVLMLLAAALLLRSRRRAREQAAAMRAQIDAANR